MEDAESATSPLPPNTMAPVVTVTVPVTVGVPSSPSVGDAIPRGCCDALGVADDDGVGSITASEGVIV